MTDPSNHAKHTDSAPPPNPGLRYARWAGYGLGIVLLIGALITLMGGADGTFPLFKALFSLIYGAVLLLPFSRLDWRRWKAAYGLLIALSAGFVFVMIVSVIFAYMAAADRGERLGVPGLEGTLIFVALLQVPVVLFQRKPDLLD